MSTNIKITVLGPTGRLGRAICQAIIQEPEFELSGAVVRAESASNGHDIGDLLDLPPIGCTAQTSLEDAARNSDLVIDASLPGMSIVAAERLAAMKGPALITGVSGFNAAQLGRINVAAQQIPILKASNFSLGVAVAEALVKTAAALPAREWDIEITETHHKMKADAPSGTAVMLAQAAARGRGVSLEEAATWSREGCTGPRETGTIGFAVSRGGSIIGEHSVRFLSELEELTISHQAYDRKVFAHGAMEASRWMFNNGTGRPPELYTMQDVVSG
jgi:4-hydroxy-tetrahydrodipicolinate reductase